MNREMVDLVELLYDMELLCLKVVDVVQVYWQSWQMFLDYSEEIFYS